MNTRTIAMSLLASLLAVTAGTAHAQNTSPQSVRGGERWAQLDRNSDGTLDRAEAAGTPKLSEHFDRIDRDRDGRLTPQETREFRQLVQSRHDARRESRRAMQARFNWLDIDDDGALTLAEIGGAAPKLSERFPAIDGNRDGRIGREEIRSYLMAQREARRSAHT